MTHGVAIEGARPERRSGWGAAAGLLVLTIIPSLGGLTRLASLANIVAPQADHARFAARPWVLVAHIVAGLVFATFGAVQFVPSLRRGSARVHRALGRVLVVAGIVAGFSGMAVMLAFDASPTQGPPLHAMRALSGLALVGFIARAVAAIRARDFAAHEAWMKRAYAIGVAPGVQALSLAPLIVLVGDNQLTNTLGMAAGWAISLAVAERSIHAARRDARANTHSATMSAVVYERYGSPDEFRVANVRRPTPARGQVLVRVEASSINALDRRMLRADPFLVRLNNGLLRPSKKKILGADVAGVVEAVGEGVTSVSVGERVFGDASHDALGCFAEYVCLRETAVSRMPGGIDAIRAASLPLAAGTALQAVRERAALRPGQRALVYGAGGAVGGYLVQILKAYGVHVVAVCSKRSAAAVRALGADEVLEVTGPLPKGAAFDVVFGVNGYRPIREFLAVLAPTGKYLMIGGESAQLFEALWRSALNKSVDVLTMNPKLLQTDLRELRALVESKALRPMVDAVYPLERVADALRAVEAGEARGKVVISVSAP
jgi:NADPH:quinone reductase-like Zn-dependent oxidoreductase/uncharacterized membrane protein